MFEHSEHALAASEAVDRVLDRFGLPPKTRRRLAGEVALEMERRYVAFAEALTIMVLLPEIQARAATVFRRDYDLADVEAEELGANVADKIHRALFAAWPRASLTAWVRRIVKNTFIDHQRKTKRKWARANRERPVANLDIYPATATQWDELAEILVDAPRELREIVRQRLWGEDWAEIAAAAGLTVEDAKASVHRLLFGGSSSPRRRSRRTSSH